jgi:Spy/CpxP family protein refolding chaperone
MKANMKTIMALSLAMFLAAGVEKAAFAEMGGHGPNGERKVEKLKEKLNLTDDQATKIENIVNAAGEKHKAIQEDTQKQIDSVLNDEQKKKYAALKEEMKEKMKERMKERWEDKEGKKKGY